MEVFYPGDHVVIKNTLQPIMEIKGLTAHGGIPYTTENSKYTCYWVDNTGENWKSFDVAELKLYKRKNLE